MPSDEGGLGDLDPELGLQGADDSQAHAHQGRLGVLGEGQVFGGPFAHQLGEVLPQGLVHLLKSLARGGEGVGELQAHADGLAALARKGEGETHVYDPS